MFQKTTKMEVILNMRKDAKNAKVFWLGRELEGQYSTLWTLFVVGDQSAQDICNALKKCQESRSVIVGHLYFGAGNQSVVTNYDILRYFVSLGYFVTYEILVEQINSVPQDILEGCHIMVCIKNNILDSLKPNDTIKFETDNQIYCSAKNQFIANDFSGYQNDVEIQIDSEPV